MDNDEKETGSHDETPSSDQVAVRAVVRAFGFWKLTNAQSARLFDVPIATWSRMKAGTFRGKLDQDKVTRASLIIGIFKALRILFNGDMADEWLKAESTAALFDGRAPIDVMTDGGIPAMLKTRRYLDSLREGF